MAGNGGVPPIPGKERGRSALIRLDKLVSAAFHLSRKEARELIRAGRAAVCGVPVRAPETKAEPEQVTVDGKPAAYREFVYLMLHKPAGILTAARDASRPTVMDLIPAELRRGGLSPVGRLDKDTSGLLLITNDGDFAHRVISPKSGVAKLYEARLASPVDDHAVRAFAEGLLLADGTKCLPARLALLPGGKTARVEVREGKYHQVRRMFAAAGSYVEALHRLRIGGLTLDPGSPPGFCRALTGKEEASVFQNPPAGSGLFMER